MKPVSGSPNGANGGYYALQKAGSQPTGPQSAQPDKLMKLQ
jgi:hypothetical protein